MATRRVVPVVQHVELPAGVAGPEPLAFDVRSFLVVDDGGLVLVDTGLQRDAEPVFRAIKEIGAGWEDVTDVLLTHGHPDHCGAVSAVASQAPAAALWGAPGDEFVHPVRAAEDGTTIRGLRVIATPGHTPGHISLLDETNGVLFTGDAVASVGGRLTLGPEPFIADRAEAIRSLGRLADLRAERVVFSHGTEVEQPAEALVQFLQVCASSA